MHTKVLHKERHRVLCVPCGADRGTERGGCVRDKGEGWGVERCKGEFVWDLFQGEVTRLIYCRHSLQTCQRQSSR